MGVLFQRPQGPTRINAVQINQSVLGYPVPVVMGKGRVQQTILWIDGFSSRKISSGGGSGAGGKGGTQYIYSADVLAGLCDGGDDGILGIGDVWSGQSWLSNTDTHDTYTISGSSPSYLPGNAPNITADYGVAWEVPVILTTNDLGAPVPNILDGSVFVGLRRVTYISGGVYSTGTYAIDPSTGTYYFSSADVGNVVRISYTFALGVTTQQQNALIPSGRNIPVGGSLPFAADVGVVYYSLGGTNNGTALTRVFNNPPTAAGTYYVDPTSGSASYTFASADIGHEVQITYKLNNSASLPAGTQTSLAFEVIPGTPEDNPAALLVTTFPGAALGYPRIAKALFAPMDLGYGAQIQQNTFEVITADSWGGGIVDCNPVQCILKVLSDAVWGLGAGSVPFPLDAIDNASSGTWGSGNGGHSGNGAKAYIVFPGGAGTVLAGTDATAWFVANNFFISPVIDRQDTAAALIGRWLEAGACAAFMSEGMMKLVPYGDTSASANGRAWTAPSAFVRDLDDSCFLKKDDGADPVKISSSNWTEAFNKVQISFSNRANQYAPELISEEDKAAVNRYGSRIEDPQSWDFITTLAAAQFAGSMRVRRNVYNRNTYQFSLPFRFGDLEAMDVVSLTTASAWSASASNTIQLVKQPARITKIVDNPDGTYDVTAEDYIFGANQPAQNGRGIGQPRIQPNQFADPGDTTAVFFEAYNELTAFKGYQLWFGAAGVSHDWGGCNILASLDGTKYQNVGTIDTHARLGTLAASFASGADPDSADTLVVNLLAGSAPLDAGTTADADQGITLCYADGEIVSYSACSVSGVDQYTMDTYIRRGQRGSTAGAHATGAQFLRLDDAVFKYTYDPSWAGKTIYIKFQSFNAYGNSLQDPSTLTAITYTVPGVNQGAFSGTTGTVLTGTGSTVITDTVGALGSGVNTDGAGGWFDTFMDETYTVAGTSDTVTVTSSVVMSTSGGPFSAGVTSATLALIVDGDTSSPAAQVTFYFPNTGTNNNATLTGSVSGLAAGSHTFAIMVKDDATGPITNVSGDSTATFQHIS